MSERRQLVPDRLGHQLFDVDVGAGEGQLGETARLDRLLDVEPVVDDVRDKLRVAWAWLKPP
jgi:hypothetical protein